MIHIIINHSNFTMNPNDTNKKRTSTQVIDYNAIKVNSPNHKYLHRAIKQDKTDLAIEWLNRWGEVLSEDTTAMNSIIRYCIRKNNEDVIKYLLDHHLVSEDKVMIIRRQNNDNESESDNENNSDNDNHSDNNSDYYHDIENHSKKICLSNTNDPDPMVLFRAINENNTNFAILWLDRWNQNLVNDSVGSTREKLLEICVKDDNEVLIKYLLDKQLVTERQVEQCKKDRTLQYINVWLKK